MTEPDGDGGPDGAAAGAPIRVLIAEDQALLRTTLAALLQAEEGMSVVGTAGDGARALALTAELRPDVVLMDIQMPGLSGIEATARICADPALGGTRVLILTMFEVDDYVLGALRAGACGFLLKDADPQSLVDAVHTVHEGQSLLSPRVLARLVARMPSAAAVGASAGRRADGVGALTPRQREVLLLIARGLSNSEIEVELGITRATCRSHITALLARLGARDRAQLVIAAYEAGLISPHRGA
ncbi:response regulator transcription factor [Actinomyces dentalis]|uniref:response regulator transcription factor n=1 Tax=Actinomyces dentalis TaxID=272548 RepID=UPI000429C87F|nr:response regulator transcription factor [Actinomyces dentalis]